MSYTCTIECRRVYGKEIMVDFKVEVCRVIFLGITICKWEKLH
jgi:hypothetical protein